MRGDGSISKVGPERFRLEFINPITKKRVTRTVRAKTKTEAKGSLRTLRDEVLKGGSRDLSGITVSEAIEAYQASPHWRALKSKSATQASLNMVLRFFGARCPLRAIGVAELHDFQDARLKKVKANTVKRDLTAFGFLILHGLKEGWLSKNPLKDMVRVKVEQREDMPWVKREEMMNFLESVRGQEPFYGFYLMNWYQAWRQGTVLGLRWEMLRDVRGQLQAWLPTKTGYKAHIIHPKVEEWLRAHWREEGPVIVNEQCQAYTTAKWHTRVARAERHEGRRFPRSHAVRRGAATAMYLAGATISQIRPVLGHTTDQQTTRYIRAVVAEGQEALGLL